MVEKVIDKTRTGEVIKVDKHVKTLKKAGITNVQEKISKVIFLFFSDQ